MRVFIPRFLGAFSYLLGLTLVGVVSYTLIEGWGFQDALYNERDHDHRRRIFRGASSLYRREGFHHGPLGRRCYGHWCLVRTHYLVDCRVRPE